MRIISLTGVGNRTYWVAFKLGNNSDVAFIQPYTDKVKLNSAEIEAGYHQVTKDTLDLLIESEEVLSSTMINGNRYVFFKFQLSEAYNVMIVDDYALVDLQSNYDGELYTVKVVTDENLKSQRIGVYLYDHEFDEVFDPKNDDYDEFEWRIQCLDQLSG